jgi:hypothetical protein
MDIFIEDDPCLVLRGCISFGPHICDGNFIIGPAVDEAAEYMNIAEGAFVWLLPNAEAIFVKSRNDLEQLCNQDWTSLQEMQRKIILMLSKFMFVSFIRAPIAIPFKMPVKNLGTLECLVVNPWIMSHNKLKCIDLIQKYSNSMKSNRIDIKIKLRNTMEFLVKGKDLNDKFHIEMDDVSEEYNTDEELQQFIKNSNVDIKAKNNNMSVLGSIGSF